LVVGDPHSAHMNTSLKERQVGPYRSFIRKPYPGPLGRGYFLMIQALVPGYDRTVPPGQKPSAHRCSLEPQARPWR
jgi:hypothetical protein